MNWAFLKKLNLFDINLPENTEDRKNFILFMQTTLTRQIDFTKFCSAALGSSLFAIGAALVAAKDKIPIQIISDIENTFVWVSFGILIAFFAAFFYGLSWIYLDTGNYNILLKKPSTRRLIDLQKALKIAFRYMMTGLLLLILSGFILVICVLNVIGIAFKLT